MFESLKRAFTERPVGEFRECRRCGTRVDGTVDCPACGLSDIARYEL
jgi:rubrerythrin